MKIFVLQVEAENCMHNKKIGIITQARMSSTRLPGKVLKEIKSQSLLTYHLQRLSLSEIPVYIATSNSSDDDPIEKFARAKNVFFFRGDLYDVLSRYYHCAKEYKLDIIIRVTSDCPLIDGHVIKEALKDYMQFENDEIYYSNCLERSFPRGMDFEIFSFKLLEQAYNNAKEDSDREHVTPYINKNIQGNVIVKHYLAEENNNDLRLTVDMPEDFNLIKELIEKYDCDKKNASEIVNTMRIHPYLKEINSGIEQKKINE
jgi:spore coat polysaccharide biosynthesis protein SpsF